MIKKRKYKFTSLLFAFGILVVLAIGLFIERNGINYTSKQSSYYLNVSQVKTKSEALSAIPVNNLVIFNSSNETSASAINNFKQIFEDMKVSTAYVDVATEAIPDFTSYKSVVVLTPDIEPLGVKAIELMDWVEAGGNVMFAMTIQKII